MSTIVGEQKCKTFMSEQLLTSEPDLFATLKATKQNTFSTMERKTKVNTSKGQIVELKNDLKFVSRLLAMGNSKSKRVDFVCDTYPDISIKNMERSSP
jgi:hypothetical protein